MPRLTSSQTQNNSVIQSSSKTGSSSCQCSTTLYGEKKKIQRNVQVIFTKLRVVLSDFLAFLRPGSEKKWYGTFFLISLMEFAEKMMIEFSEAAHPIFRASCVVERGELRSKGGGKKTIHFNGSEQNVHLILRTVISANQLSIYGAVADMCTEVSQDTTMASGKPEADDALETMEIPTELSKADPRTDKQQRRNLLQEYEQQFEQLSDAQKLSKLCSNSGLKIVERG